MADVTIIDLWPIEVKCCICGAVVLGKFGIPVDSETAEIVANDFEGEWGCVPACKACHDRHAEGEFVGEYPKF